MCGAFEHVQINWSLEPDQRRIRVGAVSYLNPVPLIWGMLHGPQRHEVDLSFSIPSVCAENLEAGLIEVGLVPVAEIARQNMAIVPGVGITSWGPVRSILLFSKVPWNGVRTLAADFSSRTSVQLARVILRERFGVQKLSIERHQPELEAMLNNADAALIIGDAALRIDPASSGYDWLDLGSEWTLLTKLPMVFAAWAGKPGLPLDRLKRLTMASYVFGRANLDEIVNHEYAQRGIPRQLADDYLRHSIRYELGPKEYEGLDEFLQLAGLAVART